MEEIWVVRDGDRIGPFAEEEILRGYESGALRGSDVLWAEGLREGATVEETFSQLRKTILTSSQELALAHIRPPADPAASPYAPPGARVADVAEQLASPSVYAGFWARFAAAMLDGVVVGLLAGFVGFGLGFLGGLVGFGETGISFLGGILGLVIGWFYFALTESGPRRASPGKRALRLQVVTADGEARISFLRATGRWAGRYLSLLPLLAGYLMQPFTARKQALHDLVAGTVVLQIGATRRWLIWLAVVLVFGLVALSFVLGAALRAIEVTGR
jgi:uncharacterized RDD family membrane protein YckC